MRPPELFAQPRRSPARWFWGAFIVIVMAALLLTAFLALRGARQWADAQQQRGPGADAGIGSAVAAEVVRITLQGGASHQVPAARLPAIRTEMLSRLDRLAGAAQKRVSDASAQSMRDARSRTLAQVPAFGDWYFSLAGEYARLFHAATGDLPAFVADKLRDLVLAPAGVDAALVELAQWQGDAIGHELQAAAGPLADLLALLLSEHGVDSRSAGVWQVVADRLAPAGFDVGSASAGIGRFSGVGALDMARQGAAATLGIAAGAATALKLGTSVAAKAAVKAGSGTVFGIGSGAAAGGAICAATVVGMPIAAGCAVIGGAAVAVAGWLAVDKLMLEGEKLLHREAVERDLRASIDAQFDAIEAGLRRRCGETVQVAFDALRSGLDQLLTQPSALAPKRDFVPVRAADGQGGAGSRQDAAGTPQ